MQIRSVLGGLLANLRDFEPLAACSGSSGCVAVVASSRRVGPVGVRETVAEALATACR